MIKQNIIGTLVNFLVFGILQILFFDYLQLFNTAFCFFYIGFILLLPFDTGRLAMLFMAFAIGLFIDIFNDTLGIHASASVVMAFLRPYWLSLNTPRGGYENVISPDIPSLGWQWFVSYAFPLILIHHLVMFFVEAGHFNMFFSQVWKSIVSCILTLIAITIYQYIFVRKARTI